MIQYLYITSRAQSEQDYQIKCPEFIPSEEVEAHKKAFIAAGVDVDKAQQVVDQLVRFGEENEKRQVEKLARSLEEDKRHLQKELGSDYEAREKDISLYIQNPFFTKKTFLMRMFNLWWLRGVFKKRFVFLIATLR